jgi:hypothetical protein
MRDNACCNYYADKNKYCGMRKPAKFKKWCNYKMSRAQRNINMINKEKGIRRYRRVMHRIARILPVG